MNKAKQIWADGGAVVAGWLQMPGALHAEALAGCGYDAVVIDLQHSPIDFAGAVPMITAIENGGAEPFVRVRWNDPGDIMQLLDAGAYGVIAPMINTVADAELLASALRYPPHGQRSYGPRRPIFRYGPGYWKKADETIVSFAMVETLAALGSLDDILKVNGIDGVFIGPTDLAISLGCPPVVDSDHPKVVEAIRYVLERASVANKAVGIFCGSGGFARARIKEGFDFVTVAPDLAMLTSAAREIIAETRGVGEREQQNN